METKPKVYPYNFAFNPKSNCLLQTIIDRYKIKDRLNVPKILVIKQGLQFAFNKLYIENTEDLGTGTGHSVCYTIARLPRRKWHLHASKPAPRPP